MAPAPEPESPTRAFVAVFPSDAVLDRLAALRREMEPRLPGLRWTGRESLHYTLRFFGDLTPDELARAAAAMDGASYAAKTFPLTLRGLGTFPERGRPRVLWVGAGGGGETLGALARELERRFADADLGRADKPFVPHLTLGRWREPPPVDPAPVLAPSRGTDYGICPVDAVVLVKSVLAPGGSIYTPLRIVRFAP